MSTTRLKAIDLFAGAGGLSEGLHRAGFDVVAAIEVDKWACETYKRNFPGATVISTDVRQVDFTRFTGLDLVAGGPPCQPFSVAGKQLARSDERDMVPEFVRAVEESRPKAFLMENVPGLLSKRHFAYSTFVVHRLQKLGYNVFVRTLDAANFGVPQHRTRVFIVGVSRTSLFAFPKATHGVRGSQPFISVREGLKGVPCDEPNTARVFYAKNPVVRSSPWAGMLVNGGGRPINLNAPSPTIPASAGGNRTHILDETGVLLEYHRQLINGGNVRSGEVPDVRRLTIRESARLQSYPDGFEFIGPKTARYKQVGNAVPPLLAWAVANSVRAALNATETPPQESASSWPIDVPLFPVMNQRETAV